MKRSTGGYVLVLQVLNSVTIQVGMLGKISMERGEYFYGGSARRGIRSRLARHFSTDKKPYWHIDYLTNNPAVRVIEAWCYPDFPEVEHALATSGKVSSEGILKGFGNGDCTRGCQSHLWKGHSKLKPEDLGQNLYIETNSDARQKP